MFHANEATRAAKRAKVARWKTLRVNGNGIHTQLRGGAAAEARAEQAHFPGVARPRRTHKPERLRERQRVRLTYARDVDVPRCGCSPRCSRHFVRLNGGGLRSIASLFEQSGTLPILTYR